MTESSEKRKFCDLKVDRDLLDPNFEGYKLCLDQLRIESRRLPSDVNEILPSTEQWSYQHARLFSGHNHLFINPWTIDQSARRVYVVLLDGVYCLSIEKGKYALQDLRKVADFEILAHGNGSGGDKVNSSLVFPSQHTAAIADGCGNLILCSIEMGHSETWSVVHREDGLCEKHAFIILDSRTRVDENAMMVDVLLQYVEETANTTQASGQGVFATVLEWITLKKAADGSTFSLHRRRRLQSLGAVIYAALSTDSNSVCCLCSKPVQFVYDSEKPVEDMEVEESRDDVSKEYSWGQTAETLCIVFALATNVSQTDIHWTLTSESVSIGFNEQGTEHALLAGDLHLPVDVEGSTWTLSDGRLEITLQKRDVGRMWPEVVLGDNRGEYVADPELVKEVSERLKDFTSDAQEKQANSGAEAAGPFNEQLEECDLAETDSSYLSWLDGETHLVTAEADVGGHQWLFNVRLQPDHPSYICLRHDVDGILWRAAADPVASCWIHSYTFNAFGYVQAGKENRKFCTCSTDCAYAVIVDCSRYAYIYWQPTAVDSDLRNRKTGRRVASVAKQQVVSIPVEEGDGHRSMDVLGVAAFDDVLLLMTKDRLLTVFVK